MPGLDPGIHEKNKVLILSLSKDEGRLACEINENLCLSGDRLVNRRISALLRLSISPDPCSSSVPFCVPRLGVLWGCSGVFMGVFMGVFLGVRSPETPKAGQVRPLHIPAARTASVKAVYGFRWAESRI
jgi:hypothetical protein